jgi:hypothetical protein
MAPPLQYSNLMQDQAELHTSDEDNLQSSSPHDERLKRDK